MSNVIKKIKILLLLFQWENDFQMSELQINSGNSTQEPFPFTNYTSISKDKSERNNYMSM